MDYVANYADLFKEENETAPEVLLSVHFKGPGLGEGSTFGVCWKAPMNAVEASMNLCDDYYATVLCGGIFVWFLEMGEYYEKNRCNWHCNQRRQVGGG